MKAFRLAAFFALASSAHAGTISIDTAGNAGNWTLTSLGTVFSAFQAGTAISITSTGDSAGTSPIDLANFDGYWLAALTFFLPANATNVALHTTSISADDKAILTLNGVDFANNLVFNGTGAGVFFRNGAYENVNYTSQQANNLTSGFVPGAVNTLLVFINNTDSASPDSLISNFKFSGAGTSFTLAGSVTFDEPITSGVPEPATFLFVGLGTAAVLAARRRG